MHSRSYSGIALVSAFFISSAASAKDWEDPYSNPDPGAQPAPEPMPLPYEEPAPMPPPEESFHHHRSSDDGFGVRFGLGINWFTGYRHHHNFISGNIPTLDVDIPIAHRYFLFELGWRQVWGFTKFYAKGFFPMLGLRLYPFGSVFSLYGKGGWGTFLFNDSTLIGEGGVSLDIPVGGDGDSEVYVSPGAGYFYQKGWKLADFIERDQWHITSPGWVFSLDLVVRAFD